MPQHAPLAAEQLFCACDPGALGFETSDTLPELDAADLHGRAVEAIRLGLDIGAEGYNLFVLGDTGSGRHGIVTRLLEAERHDGPPPADWCYVWNFDEASHPRLLRLPSGRGPAFRDDMQRFVEELIPAIAAVFESDQYRNRIEALQEEAKQREETALRQLGDEAQTLGVALLRTPHGFAFLPMKDADSTLSQEEFAKLPEDRQHELGEHITTLRERMHLLMNEFPRWRRELQNRIRDAGRDALGATVTHMIDELRPRYADLPDVGAHLDNVLKDIIAGGESLHAAPRSEDDGDTLTYSGSITVQRYLVNLLVPNPADGTRPVVVEDHPTLQNLVGRIDHLVHMGTLVSNFTLIRAGALHRANGGFLVLEAEQVLEQPYAWQGLKRALRSKSLKLSSLEQMLTLTGTISLEPDGIPFNVKVVLLGDRETFYLLQQFDPELGEFFKMRADFENSMPRTPENERKYAHFLADFVQKEQLRPLERSALMRLVEEAARDADDQEKLSLHAASVGDLLREANYWAGEEGARVIRNIHIQAALDGQERRHERLRKLYMEEIAKGTQLFTGEGEVVGQVNGLTVVQYADAEFGMPSRISVTAHYGHGDITDIERDVELGGAIHSKGVLILTSYLKAVFGAEHALRFAANIAFEQSYSGVDGDSASLGELCGLLSAIGKLPIRQSLAVTGSVDQYGRVQAIGGVNEKIEGFYAACQLKGLKGPQAVIIPVQNVRHLMLREDVLNAVREKRFAVYAVSRVEEAIELLLGLPAGKPGKDGLFPAESVFGKVAARMEVWRLAEKRDDEKDDEDDEEKPKSKPVEPPARKVRRR